MVRCLSSGLAIPTSCKVRLLPSFASTLRFCRGLQGAGCALLAVHGRQRGSPSRRRSGPADLHAIRALKRALSIPVLSNGNVRSGEDVSKVLRFTRADGAMVGEALLRYPAMFALAERPSQLARRAVMREYLQLAQVNISPASHARIAPLGGNS